MGYYNIGGETFAQLDTIEDSLNTQLGLKADAAPANFTSDASVIGLLKRVGIKIEEIAAKTFSFSRVASWIATSGATTVAIAESAAADAAVAKAAIENRGSATIYFGFGSAAPASTNVMLKLPPGYGWLEEGTSAAHLKIWTGGSVSTVFIARWTA